MHFSNSPLRTGVNKIDGEREFGNVPLDDLLLQLNKYKDLKEGSSAGCVANELKYEG